jgi:dihydrolipoamide dehydrogenase
MVGIGGSLLARGADHAAGGNVLATSSEKTIVATDAVIDTSGVGNSSAGNTVIWSDQNTAFRGTILAKGGDAGGNGGRIEVSGHDNLAFTGQVDTNAPSGSTGTLLLDPTDIIVATGGAPARIPGLEFDGNLVIGSTEALQLEAIPKRIAILGAGAIGSEFAFIWSTFGAQVTVFEMMPTVLPREDEELSEKLKALMKKRGIDVRTGTIVKHLTKSGNVAHLDLEGEKPESVDADLVLVSIGLKCNSEVVGGIKGIQLTKRGGISVNNKLETGVPGLYAIGDVVDKTWLAHGASAEGLVAAANATGGNEQIDYRVVPACTFTMPELASVGMSEKKAREAGINVKVGRFNYIASGRAQTLGETDGMVKIVGDAKTDEVLGMHILGAQAGELIATGAVAMAMEATVDELANTIYTHPTLSECIKEAAEDYKGEGIHTPPRKK